MALQVTLAFDPGGTTGFAALNEDGRVLLTAALTLAELEDFVALTSLIQGARVVIESGPAFRHDSPITRRAEEICREAFPDANLVPPSQWKSHPASKLGIYKYATQHEKDAARLAHWFQANGGINAEVEGAEVTAGADSVRTGHQRN